MAIDWLPTITEIVGGKKASLPIDGRSAKSLLFGEPGAAPPHEALFFYAGTELHAIRSGEWKLHFAHPYLTTAGEPGRGGKPSNWGKASPRSITDSSMDAIASRHGQKVAQLGPSLFHLPSDPGETKNVAVVHPDVVARMLQLAEPMRAELGDSLTNVRGTGTRAAGVER
jgi:arylsulfatase A-like enzyme